MYGRAEILKEIRKAFAERTVPPTGASKAAQKTAEWEAIKNKWIGFNLWLERSQKITDENERITIII